MVETATTPRPTPQLHGIHAMWTLNWWAQTYGSVNWTGHGAEPCLSAAEFVSLLHTLVPHTHTCIHTCTHTHTHKCTHTHTHTHVHTHTHTHMYTHTHTCVHTHTRMHAYKHTHTNTHTHIHTHSIHKHKLELEEMATLLEMPFCPSLHTHDLLTTSQHTYAWYTKHKINTILLHTYFTYPHAQPSVTKPLTLSLPVLGTPSAADVDCGDPGRPANGDSSFSSTVEGASVLHSCQPGYSLVGDRRRVCRGDGRWSGSLPECRGEALDQKTYS